MLERAVILAPGSALELEDFTDLGIPSRQVNAASPCRNDGLQSLEEVERAHIQRVLQDNAWVIEGPRGAASILGLNPSTLRSRMQKLGIKKPSLSNFSNPSTPA